MASETTNLLRRAVTLRHSAEARVFWSAALEALVAGTADPAGACRLLSAAMRAPVAADTVTDWLAALIRSCGDPIDPARVLARAPDVATALDGLRLERPPATARSTRMRVRVREAMAVTTAALEAATV
jgi:hypothetical protein